MARRGQRDDSDQLAVCAHDGKPSDLMGAHTLLDGVDGLVGATHDDVAGHSTCATAPLQLPRTRAVSLTIAG